MLTISKMFTILCLLWLCGNKEYPSSYQNKSVSSSFRSVPNYILFLVKLKGEGVPFNLLTYLEWTGIDLSSKLSLTCGGNVNFYKSVHHPVPTLPVGIGNALAIFKTKKYILFLAKLNERGRPILDSARRGATL